MTGAVGSASKGCAIVEGIVALVTVLACEAKVYPEATPDVTAVLEAETVPRGTAAAIADAGETAIRADAASLGHDASPRGGDRLEPPAVVDAGCTPVALYRDRDGDGFGSNSPQDVIRDCPPVEGFVLDNTDCHDAEHTALDPAGDVFPGQPVFFTVGYPTARSISFDYDCSEFEEADPRSTFVPAPTNCEDRQPPLCGADLGYLTPPDPRIGDGVNALCGERQRGLCQAAGNGACGLNAIGAANPFPCR